MYSDEIVSGQDFAKQQAAQQQAFARVNMAAQLNPAAGYAGNSIREVESAGLEDIARRTAAQLETAQETVAVLDALHCRLFGPRPPTAGHGAQDGRTSGPGHFDTLRDLKSELSSRLNRINSLAHELNTRI